ncbi:hypothetical protein [Cognatishimia sp. F0-27]|uniref:hypothetical protein n=1 Tax=Cognatishimia sp. F0-27 TaxID=2816855 RepID=UPI001D0BFA01|nr:hypothetical protein [Cognatishimia sp. F0-27]MCC1491416.1 hypothetical protein [Cognatishimia sp. F0-27]
MLGLPDPVIAEDIAETLDIEAGGLFVMAAAEDMAHAFTDQPMHKVMQARRPFRRFLGAMAL